MKLLVGGRWVEGGTMYVSERELDIGLIALTHVAKELENEWLVFLEFLHQVGDEFLLVILKNRKNNIFRNILYSKY